MGRKAKRMNVRQAQMVLDATGDAFQSFNEVYSVVHDNHPKNAALLRKYHTVWLFLQEFLDLMELEVERSCLV